MKILTAFILILSSQMHSYAEQQLTIGVEEISYFPYYTLEDGIYRGYLRDIMDSFAKQHNYIIRYIGKSPAELTDTLIKGTVGFALPDNDYWSTDKKKGYSITEIESWEPKRIGGRRKMRPLTTGALLSYQIIKEFIFWKFD